jgi:hypothetical protein
MTNIDDIMIKSALEAVSCMNAVFSGLDKVIDQHNVYKVKANISQAKVRIEIISWVSGAGGDYWESIHGSRWGPDQKRYARQRRLYRYILLNIPSRNVVYHWTIIF